MELDAKRDAVSGSDCLRTKAPFGAVAPTGIAIGP